MLHVTCFLNISIDACIALIMPLVYTLGPKGEKVLGVNDEGILKPVSRLLDKDEAARRNEQINNGGPKPGDSFISACHS